MAVVMLTNMVAEWTNCRFAVFWIVVVSVAGFDGRVGVLARLMSVSLRASRSVRKRTGKKGRRSWVPRGESSDGTQDRV